jgi:rhodanese-related sulfurtransferase
VAQELREQGFTEAYALTGGLDAWRQAGGAVVPK